MTIHFLEDEKIYLRPVERTDLNDDYLSWVNDPEVTKFMETGTFPTNMEQLTNWYENKIHDPNTVLLTIITKPTEKDSREVRIGNIMLSQIHWVNRTACLGIMIGNKDYWNKEYGTEACKLLTEYAFKTLGLQKVWLGVISEHAAAIMVYEKVGFHIVATLRREVFKNGNWYDKCIMSKLGNVLNEENLLAPTARQ